MPATECANFSESTKVWKPIVAALILALGACAAQRPLIYDATTRMPAHERSESDLQLIVTIRESERALNAAPGATPRAYENAARYRPSTFARRIADEIVRDYALEPVAEWRIAVLGVHCIVFAARTREARERALQRLQKDKRIESAQPMQQYRTAAAASAVTPAPAPPVPPEAPRYNDPYYALQRQVEEIRVPEAQRWTRGRGIRIAVIDTGVDLRHPELAGRVRIARNFVDDDIAAFSRDLHGTAVAGAIAAVANNGVGIVGVAPSVQLLALKACWHSGADGNAVCNTLTLAEALAFAIENKAAVINLSLAGPPDSLLRRLVENALRRGIVVVCADPGSADVNESFPLAVPGVLPVADGDLGHIAANASPVTARISVPGREVLTLAPGGRYHYLSGASLSSAMVSGVVALLLERNPALTQPGIAVLLESTAFPAPSDSGVPAAPTRAGQRPLRVVDACGAVAAVTAGADCGEPASPSPTIIAAGSSKKSM